MEAYPHHMASMIWILKLWVLLLKPLALVSSSTRPLLPAPPHAINLAASPTPPLHSSVPNSTMRQPAPNAKSLASVTSPHLHRPSTPPECHHWPLKVLVSSIVVNLGCYTNPSGGG
jgi:hypothetical protein